MKFQSVSKAFADKAEVPVIASVDTISTTVEKKVEGFVDKGSVEKGSVEKVLSFLRSIPTDTLLMFLGVLVIYILFLNQKIEKLSSLHESVLVKLLDKL